jgi:hypothetical protein
MALVVGIAVAGGLALMVVLSLLDLALLVSGGPW